MHCLHGGLCIASEVRLPLESYTDSTQEDVMVSRRVSRRRFVAGTAAASTAFVAAPFVRGAHAAGKLSVGFWDHWVPNANAATEKLIREWAEKEKVDVQIDFITSQGNKLLLTIAAEA